MKKLLLIGLLAVTCFSCTTESVVYEDPVEKVDIEVTELAKVSFDEQVFVVNQVKDLDGVSVVARPLCGHVYQCPMDCADMEITCSCPDAVNGPRSVNCGIHGAEGIIHGRAISTDSPKVSFNRYGANITAFNPNYYTVEQRNS